MYLIEIIAKFLQNRKNKKNVIKPEFFEEIQEIEDYESCKHLYVAIDSTKRHLACNNCGHIIKNPGIKKDKNIFKNY